MKRYDAPSACLRFAHPPLLRWSLPLLCLLALTLSHTPPPALAQGILPVYSITHLPPLAGGTQSFATAVNANGDVVGGSSGGNLGSNFRATLWPAGGDPPVDLGVLPGGSRSIASDINDDGVIVGHSHGQAVVWRDRAISALPPLSGDGGGFAHGINNAGVIVGESRGLAARAVRWSNDQASLLFNSPGYFALDINDSGDITGGGVDENGFRSGWVIRGGRFIPLGTTGVHARGIGINSLGIVVGSYLEQGVFWTPAGEYGSAGTVFLAPTGFSEVDSVNTYNQAVGYNQASDFILTALFARSNEFGANSSPRPLADYLPANSGFSRLLFAGDISERGRIVGQGQRTGGEFHAFVMTPPAVDLAVTANTDLPDPTTPGSQVNYAFTIKNKGLAPAEGVRVTSTLTNLSFVAIAGDPTGTKSTVNGNVITWAFNSRILEPGEEIVFSVFANAVAAGTASNLVTISTPVHSELNGADNQLTETTRVQGVADLELAVTDSPDPAIVNQEITYQIALRNAGPDAAGGVLLTASLNNLNFVSANAPGAVVQQNGSTVTLAYSDAVPAGQTVNASILARSPAEGMASLRVVTATSDSDPDPGDNEATASTTINPVPADAADLAVSVEDSPDPVILGNQINYDIEVLNLGPEPATGIVLTIQTGGVTDVRVKARGGAVDDQGDGKVVVTFDRLTLRPNGKVGVKATARAGNPAVAPFLTAGAAADQADPDFSNNQETESTTIDSPDLTGGALSIGQRRVRSKSFITGTAVVHNIGTSAARASLTAFYLVPFNEAFDPNVHLRLKPVKTPAIPANDSRTIRLNLPVRGVDPSGMILYMWPDGVPLPNGRVAEFNENNVNSSAMVPNPDGTFPP